MNFYLLEKRDGRGPTGLELWKLVQARTLSEAVRSVLDEVRPGDFVRCTLLSVSVTVQRVDQLQFPSGWAVIA